MAKTIINKIKNSTKKYFIYILCVLLAATSAPLLSGCSARSGSRSGLDGSLLESDLDSAREGRFGSGNIPTAEGEGPFRTVFFAYDSSSLDATARSDIEGNAALLKDYPNVHIVLEGHTDERGTEEYNLQLGQARARAVHNFLISLGIEPERLESISYGENIPLEVGQSEAAYARNRRVYFATKSGTNGEQLQR